MTTVDLHLHSNFSNDGEFSPQELVHLCLAAGLTHAAIADHNSVKAVSEACRAAERTGLCMIPAIEMDCDFDGVILHLLGYGIDHNAPIFTEIEASVHKLEQANSEQLLRLVRQLGIAFEDAVIAELAFDGVVTGEMIAEAALLYDSEGKNPLLDPYRGGGSRSDNPYVNFYWDYCSQGKPAYTPMDFISLREAVGIIRSNHGVPVLAHPGLQVKENLDLLARIIAEGIAGLEAYSSYHTAVQARFYQNAAQSNKLLVTCGSDFHGKTKQNIKIGSVECGGQEQQIVTALTDAIDQA